MTDDMKCKIARETADYLTPETWIQGSLLVDPSGYEIGDEQTEVDFLKDHGTEGKWPVCLVGSLVRACFKHVPDYDYNNSDHYILTQDLATVLAEVIDDRHSGTPFGTITQFNDEDDYEYDEESGSDVTVDKFPKIKDTANTFADRVCNRPA